MKKMIYLLIIILFFNSIITKENQINKKCWTKIKNYIENEIKIKELCKIKKSKKKALLFSFFLGFW
jgi:hypothetical protein